MILRTCRRFIMAVDRQQRIKRVARQIRWKPLELVSFGAGLSAINQIGKARASRRSSNAAEAAPKSALDERVPRR
jgi:hypothetical protein